MDEDINNQQYGVKPNDNKTTLAVSKAYEDIENGLIYKNIFNSVFDLAKREVI